MSETRYSLDSRLLMVCYVRNQAIITDSRFEGQHVTTDVLKVTQKRCLRTDLLRTERCRIIGDRKEPCDHGMPVVLFL